jgi:PAS domain S-box-containing protein
MKGHVHMRILSLPAWLRRLGYYGLALVLVALGVIMRVALTHLVGPGLSTYVTFYPLVMLAALLGGWGPGLLAILATAAVADYWLLLPPGLFKIESMVDLVGLAFFCVMGMFVSVVAELYRRLRGHLEELVVVRTTALHQANERLQEQAEELQTQAEELQDQTEELTAANEGLRESEQALRESEEKYRDIVETATEAIVMVDAEARIIFVNDRWSEVFGYSREEAARMTHFELVFPEDKAQMRERWESRKRGRKESYELRLRRKDGRPVWVLVGVAPRFDPAGKFLGTLVMLADITDRKQAEEALRELNATLEKKVAERTEELEHRAGQLQKLTLELTQAEERERKRLAQLLHDDLQQVLAAAKFHVSLLGSRVKSDAAAQKVTVQVNDLLGDAIDKSRRLSHELSAPALADNDLSQAFEWLAQQMQTQHGFTVHLNVGARIEVASEPLRILLYKAAQELLFNVIKHGGVREAKLRLRHRRGRLWLSVSDHGRGFDPAQAGQTLGFGLLSIRERIGLLGGRLKIKSAIGEGSTFVIAVPDSDAREPALSHEAPSTQSAVSAPEK